MRWEQQEMMRLLRNAPGTAYQEADAVNRSIFRDWIRALLHVQSAKITFVKADGTQRDMLCTLNWQKIPQDKLPKSATVKESVETNEPEALRVFDIELGEWRSFRYDRIRSIQATIAVDK